MVDERGLNVNNANHHEVERISLISNAEKLRIHLFNRTEPIVFDGAARQWTCSRWTPGFDFVLERTRPRMNLVPTRKRSWRQIANSRKQVLASFFNG